MAVTITTQFYASTAYNSLAKVVFTSPNIITPSAAGTRSHILPGELPLATWYEDTTNMYRKFNSQSYSVEDFIYTNPYAATVSGFHIRNSVKFQLTQGESYNNRLTAWDDVTHSSIDNELIASDRVKVSAVAYRYGGTDIAVTTTGIVFAPRYNFVLKGNTTSGITNNYYGDFNMIYATPTTTLSGDVLIFRPYLDNITSEITYGVHDFVITLHYSYT